MSKDNKPAKAAQAASAAAANKAAMDKLEAGIKADKTLTPKAPKVVDPKVAEAKAAAEAAKVAAAEAKAIAKQEADAAKAAAKLAKADEVAAKKAAKTEAADAKKLAAAQAAADKAAAIEAAQAGRKEAEGKLAALAAEIQGHHDAIDLLKADIKAIRTSFPHATGGSTGDALKGAAARYVKHPEVKTASGASAIDNGDPVAEKLRGLDLDAVYALVAKASEEDEATLRAKYQHLNAGMQRMNLGNKLRGVINAK